jgi:hypothetical protein
MNTRATASIHEHQIISINTKLTASTESTNRSHFAQAAVLV